MIVLGACDKHLQLNLQGGQLIKVQTPTTQLPSKPLRVGVVQAEAARGLHIASLIFDTEGSQLARYGKQCLFGGERGTFAST